MPPPEPSTALVTYTLRNVKDAGNFIFRLNIDQIAAAQINYDPNDDVDGRPSDEDLSEDLGDDGWPDDDGGVAGARPQA